MYSKYRAKKIVTDDGKFDSKREFERWCQLKEMEKEKTIKHLRRQVVFQLIPSQYINGKVAERACSYKADFVYEFMDDTIVEDAKGFRTPEYIIKRKLMLWVHGIKIVEV